MRFAYSITSLFFLLSIFVLSKAQAYERKELIDNRLNPGLNYDTIETPHFSIHYPEHLKEPAVKISNVCEKVYKNVSGYFGWDLNEKTHIVVSDRSDQVSLFTIGFPHKQIFFDISPRLNSLLGLNEYGDWYEWLLTHEFGHVYQQDRKAGVYSFLENIVGATSQPNMAAPAWFKEGLSTILETNLTQKGRGNGPFYRMYIRQAVLGGDLNNPDFVSLDTINNHLAPTWPWTIRAYVFGYYLVRKMDEHTKRSVELVQKVAAGLPYGFEKYFREVTSQSLFDFWQDLKKDLTSEFSQEIRNIESQKLTTLKYLTDSGFYKSGLTLSPNGKWLLSTQVVPEKETRIIRLKLDGPLAHESNLLNEEFILDRSSGSQISFSKSSRFIAFDEASRFQKYYTLNDVAIYDLKEKQYSSISPHLRARDPDIHPDGKHLVFVLNDKGKNYLKTADTAWENQVDLLGNVGFSRISNPRFSADGSSIVMTIHNEDSGGEDLVLYSNQKAVPLVSNGSLNFGPTWVPGKNQIIFSSDMRDGVFNIYLYDLNSKKVSKLTNVVGGLFYPVVSSDLASLYCVSYHSNGYDIVQIAFDPTQTEKIDEKTLLTSLKQSYMPSEALPNSPQIDSKIYSGLHYLSPQYLTPSVLFLPDTFQIGATLGAVDPLFLHHYELTLREDAGTKTPVGRVFYYNGANETSWDLDLSRQSYPDVESGLPFQKVRGQLGLTIPIKNFLQNSFVRPHVDYSKTDFDHETNNFGAGVSLIDDTEFTQWGLSFPEQGHYTELGGIHYFPGSAGNSDYSILSFKYRRHAQISGRTIYHAALDVSAYLSQNPDLNNAILLGSKISFPYSWESDINFFGYPTNNFLARDTQVITQRVSFSLSQLETFFGSWTPLYLQRVSGAVVAQVGRANVFTEKVYPWSVGLEIYQDFILGHLFGLRGSLGVYQGDAGLGGQTQGILSIEHGM